MDEELDEESSVASTLMMTKLVFMTIEVYCRDMLKILKDQVFRDIFQDSEGPNF